MPHSALPARAAAARCNAYQTIHFDHLEPRKLLSVSADLGAPLLVQNDAPLADVVSLVVAGDPNGTPADSPSLRVDANTTSSPYAGVGSVLMQYNGGSYVGSAAAISPTHIITAGHNVDLNNDGTVDLLPSQFSFILNYGGSQTHRIFASEIHLHPDYTGFNKPSVNDDLAIVTLSQPLPAGVPIYPIDTSPFDRVKEVTLVGYGRTGDGVNGYYGGTDLSVKRVGGQHADSFRVDDEGTGSREVWEFDFDGANGAWNKQGGGTLGNNIEAHIGGGDSGGPSFVTIDGIMKIFGINTYAFGNYIDGQVRHAPFFGSGGGGMVLSAYAGWIGSIVNFDAGGGSGGGGGTGTQNTAPVANDDLEKANNKGTVRINVLANDTDADGDSLAVHATTSPANGTIVLNADQTIAYTANSGFTGTDTFTYQVTDGELTSNWATVTVTVEGKGGGGGNGNGGGNGGGGGPNKKLEFLQRTEFATFRTTSLFSDTAVSRTTADDQAEDRILLSLGA